MGSNSVHDTYKTMAHNRPDITLRDKMGKIAYLIDIAVPNTNNVHKTVQHKISKYAELAVEIEKQWKTKVQIIPIGISTSGLILKTTVQNVYKLGGTIREIRLMQKAVILHTTNILRGFVGE